MGMLMGHQQAQASYNDIYYTDQVQPQHQSSWTHEAIAGAAGFAAMNAYESHLRATGQQPSHQMMKEILAGIAAAEVDKLVETKGLDWIDREKAKHMAVRQAHALADQRYQGGTGYEYAQQYDGPAQEYDFGGRSIREYAQPYWNQGGYTQDYYGGGGGGYGGGGYGGGGYGPPPGPPQGYGPPEGGYGGGYGGPQGGYGGGYGGPQGGYGGPQGGYGGPQGGYGGPQGGYGPPQGGYGGQQGGYEYERRGW